MKATIEILNRQFRELYSAWRTTFQMLNSESLYRRNATSHPESLSSGEHIVKSARIVEQAFGGITANLWDDPFEWTLPETLTTWHKLLGYLDEVEDARRRGFELFQTDQDLLKTIMTPAGPTQVMSLLLDTLVRAGHHQLNAAELFQNRVL